MKKNKKPVDLGVGGWTGWLFSPYGRAAEWRLIDPQGTAYTPGEIRELRALALDVDYLRMRVREMEAETAGSALPLTDDEIGIMHQAADILRRRLPASRRRNQRPFSRSTALRLVR